MSRRAWLDAKPTPVTARAAILDDYEERLAIILENAGDRSEHVCRRYARIRIGRTHGWTLVRETLPHLWTPMMTKEMPL
jgi:hypothetical protein